MTTPDELDQLLTSMGHPARDDRLDLSEWGYYQTDEEYGSKWQNYRLFEPLSQRAWLAHFDAEGNYFEKGEHSQLVRALLTIAGVDPLPEVRDTFISGQGWLIEILDEERPLAFFSGARTEVPSDYAEIPLVSVLVSAFGEGEFRVVSLATGDQSACLCVMPEPVYEELVEREWLAPCEGTWEPSPDELLASWLGDEPPPDVERLSPEEAKQRVDDAPDDWFGRL